MNISVRLNNPFSYARWPIVLLFIVLLISAVVFLILWIVKKENAKKKNAPKVVAPMPSLPPTRGQVKMRYLQMVDQYEMDYQKGTLSQRDCYQNLSQCVRHFASDMSGRDVTKLTLTELGLIGMPEVKNLIEEYYEPEFAKESKADVEGAIARTKKVMEEWN